MSIRIFSNKQPNVHEAIDIYCDLDWGEFQDYNLEIWKRAFDNSDFIKYGLYWFVFIMLLLSSAVGVGLR